MKKILNPGRNCMGEYNVDSSGLLIDGRNYYRAFYHAATKAKRYILIAGWQFDSKVVLLRGDDAKVASGDTAFLPFLNSLCDKNPELEIYILAWDFYMIYSLDREFMQDWLFNWNSNERIKFIFDDKHAVGASHHQKLVVIDGFIGFVGGMDICSNRWDDRQHLPNNPLRRNYAGKAYEPYHDIQTYLSGPIVDKLKDIFIMRWRHAGGPDLSLTTANEQGGHDISMSQSIEAVEVSLSRTQSRTLLPPQKNIREIRSLYIDAIDSAEHLIYIENQYFSSQVVYQAIMNRLRASERSPLQIVMILPKQPHSLLENVSLGIAQAKMLQSLNDSASQHGHSVGIYYTAPSSEGGLRSPTYIHSKVLLVDDRFLSVGSANTNNRSMGLDTELNVSWEAHTDNQNKLIESIRHVRISLLAEHCGISDDSQISRLGNVETLVELLTELADDPAYHLQHHTLTSFIDKIEFLKDIKPEDLAIDPERPVVEENVYNLISGDNPGFFAEGISMLNELLSGQRQKYKPYETSTRKVIPKPSVLKLTLYRTSVLIIKKYRKYIITVIIIVLLVSILVLFVSGD